MEATSIVKKNNELRKENGFTQRELADKVNVTNKAVSKWENGVNFPDPGLMDSLAEALGVTVSELVEAKTEPVKVNKPLLYAAIIFGLIPVAAAFLLASLELWSSEPENWIGYAMFAAQVVAFVVFTIVAMQEMTYTKKSKGLVSRLGMFLVMCLAFVFLVCRMHPVMW